MKAQARTAAAGAARRLTAKATAAAVETDAACLVFRRLLHERPCSSATWLGRRRYDGAAVTPAVAGRIQPRHAHTAAAAAAAAEDEEAGSGGGSGPGPLEEFNRRVRAGALLAGDARQVEALKALQTLRNHLVDAPPKPPPRPRWRMGMGHAADDAAAAAAAAAAASPVARVTRAALDLIASSSSSPSSTSQQHELGRMQNPQSQGVYLHGGVGRGKTMLMDLFHSTLPPSLARLTRRTHFHEFMGEVHRRLHAVRKGHEDPLAAVAAAVHAESPVLCFDEVELVDVADALVLKRIFEHVFALGRAVQFQSSLPIA
jgi:predicted ATPase